MGPALVVGPRRHLGGRLDVSHAMAGRRPARTALHRGAKPPDGAVPSPHELRTAALSWLRIGRARLSEPAGETIVLASDAPCVKPLRTCFAGRRQDGPARPTTFEIFAAGLAAHATVTGDRIEVSTGRAEAPDIRISAGEHYRALIAGQVAPEEYAHLPDVEIEGDPALLSTFAELFRLPLRSLDPVV